MTKAQEIAKAENVSLSTAYRRLRDSRRPDREELFGMEVQDVMDMWAVTEETAKRWLRYYGLLRPGRKRIPIPPREELVGLSTQDIMDRWGVCYKTALGWRKNRGTTMNQPYSDEFVGLSVEDVMERWGVSRRVARRWLGLEGRRESIIEGDRLERFKYWVDKCFTDREIAEEIGCDISTVAKTRKKLGIGRDWAKFILLRGVTLASKTAQMSEREMIRRYGSPNKKYV